MENTKIYTSAYVENIPVSTRASEKTRYITEKLEKLPVGKTIRFDFMVSKKFATDTIKRKSVNGKTYFTRIR